jgi:acetylglutamate kinase
MQTNCSQPLVIKIGGAILADKKALTRLLRVIKNIKNTAIVLVHGGGCVVDEMLAQAGCTTLKKQGLRVTPSEQMPIIAGALAGNVNKNIVAQANSIGLCAVGLSLVDGDMVHCQLSDQTLGAVGKPQAHSSVLLDAIIQQKLLAVICSIGALSSGELVNVNADDAAVAICKLLNAQLLLLTDVEGVQDAEGNKLNSLTIEQAQQLITQGVIAGGMTAKVNAALAAANYLRRSIAVASWKTPEKIIELLSGHAIGTRILPQ